MGFDEDSAEILKTPEQSKGGLVVKKRKTDDGFKKPSAFGLEKLAEQKRKEREREGDSDRNYRQKRIETPSNTGGVSDKYYERRRDRDRREKERRDYQSSRNRGSRYEDWEEDDRDSSRRDRDRNRDRERRGGRSERSGTRSWETPTPGRTPRESPSPYIRYLLRINREV